MPDARSRCPLREVGLYEVLDPHPAPDGSLLEDAAVEGAVISLAPEIDNVRCLVVDLPLPLHRDHAIRACFVLARVRGAVRPLVTPPPCEVLTETVSPG